eukprot:146209-Chlamydomonas_euryale.AAC.2
MQSVPQGAIAHGQRSYHVQPTARTHCDDQVSPGYAHANAEPAAWQGGRWPNRSNYPNYLHANAESVRRSRGGHGWLSALRRAGWRELAPQHPYVAIRAALERGHLFEQRAE